MKINYFDWSKSDLIKILNEAESKGRESISLSMDHVSYNNELQVMKWIKELGHEAKHDIESIIVTLNKKVNK